MRKLRYLHIDVFARRQLEGNPLAVFTNPDSLSGEDMQRIAREMSLSETTFVLRRDESVERAKGVRVRIFTTREELPFAGHPTLGTAWVLKGDAKEAEINLDLNVGKVPVRFSTREGRPFGEMSQPEPVWGATHDKRKVAVALGIQESDIYPDAPVETVSTGNPFVIVAFRSLDKLQKLRPNPASMEDYLSTTDAKNFYLVSRETIDESARLHARMIFYGGEDPATGSAAGPAAAWMLRHGWTKPQEFVWIEQGIEVSRPSQLFVRAGGSPSKPSEVRVGGFCFGVMEGELTLDGVG